MDRPKRLLLLNEFVLLRRVISCRDSGKFDDRLKPSCDEKKVADVIGLPVRKGQVGKRESFSLHEVESENPRDKCATH